MSGKRSSVPASPAKVPWKGKWVYCYQPNVDCAVKIVGQSVNYWVVDHVYERVLKCACSTTPSTRIKAVRNPRCT